MAHPRHAMGCSRPTIALTDISSSRASPVENASLHLSFCGNSVRWDRADKRWNFPYWPPSPGDQKSRLGRRSQHLYAKVRLARCSAKVWLAQCSAPRMRLAQRSAKVRLAQCSAKSRFA